MMNPFFNGDCWMKLADMGLRSVIVKTVSLVSVLANCFACFSLGAQLLSSRRKLEGCRSNLTLSAGMLLLAFGVIDS